MSSTSLWFQKGSPWRRITARVSMLLALVLGACLLETSSAAAFSSVSLSPAAGHTCEAGNSVSGTTPVFCVEVAIYHGMVTAQVEGICEVGTTLVQCPSVFAHAAEENGSGKITQGNQGCGAGTSVACLANKRNYFWPLGEFPALSPGVCLDNVWATLSQDSGIGIDGVFQDFGSISTPHFDACDDTNGVFHFYQI